MNNEDVRRFHGERGASLILAIVFMVVIGGISAAVLATTTSGLQDRVALDQTRNREYAADAGIERSVARIRNLASPACATPDLYSATSDSTFKDNPIRVQCSPVPTRVLVVDPTNGGLELVTQNDLSFAACGDTGQPCKSTTTIINAQVNFQGAAPATTFVQSWSVNG